MSFFRVVLITALLLSIALPLSSSFCADSLWTVDCGDKPKWVASPFEDRVIVWTEGTLCCHGADSGAILWKRKISEKITGITVQPVVNPDQALITGTWKAEKYSRYKTKHGFFMGVTDFNSGEQIWVHDSIGIECYRMQILDKQEQVLIHYKNTEDKHRWGLYDLADGRAVWDNDLFYSHKKPTFKKADGHKSLIGCQPLVFDTDSTFISLMDRHHIKKWNLQTGELIWKRDIKARKTPLISEGWAPMTLNADSSVLYYAADVNLYAVRTSDGSPVWDKQKYLEGEIGEIFKVDQGIVVKTVPDDRMSQSKVAVYLLDRDTGEPVWVQKRGKLKNFKQSTNSTIHDGRLVFWAADRIFSIDIESGEVSHLRESVKFEGDEKPVRLLDQDNVFLLASPQNVAQFSWDGTAGYHAYHKHPGLSDATVIGVVLGSIALQLIGTAIIDGKPSVSGVLVPEAKPNPYRPFVITREHSIMVAEIDVDGKTKPGLVKLDLGFGTVADRIVLPSRNTCYTATDSGNLAYLVDDKSMTCYRLE